MVSSILVKRAFCPELEESSSAGAQALVVIAFEGQALSIVREAIDQGFYSAVRLRRHEQKSESRQGDRR